MEFEIKDIIYIALAVSGAVASFYISRHRFKEDFDKKLDELKAKIESLKDKDATQDVELEKLRSKDALQGLTIDQIDKQMNLILKQLFEALNTKGDKK